MPARLTRFSALIACFAALLAGLLLIARPWYLTWGADEAVRWTPLPGDQLLGAGVPRETRAIEIAAPAERVWPWVAQLGQDRGGFYSYEILEDLAGCQMTNLDHLDPALQTWRPGDKLWMYPPGKAGGIGQAPLAAYQPGRALAFYTRATGTRLDDPPDGVWAFAVEPAGAGASRLIVRGHAQGSATLLGVAFVSGIFEPMHFAMERKMMEGIRDRAEGRRVSAAADNLQVLLWTVTFIAFVASAALVIMGRDWRRRLVTFTAAGLLFAVLTLVQPTLLAGVPAVLALCLAVWAPRHPAAPLAAPGRERPGITSERPLPNR